MSTIKVQWTASDEAVRKEYIKTGQKPVARRTFRIDLTELTPSQRRPIIEYLDYRYSLDVSIRCTASAEKFHLRNRNGMDCSGSGEITYDQEPTVKQVVAYCEGVLAELATAAQYVAGYKAAEKAEKERIASLRAEWQPKLDALIAAEDIDGLNVFHAPQELKHVNDEASDAWKKLKRDLAKWDKAAWIEQHGSQHLKDATAAGYDCQREYVIQRAAKEFPGFEVDFNGKAGWQSRPCPSPTALKLAKKVSGDVVWLTEPASSELPQSSYEYYEYYEPEEFEAREAVVVSRYLNRYDLVKIV